MRVSSRADCGVRALFELALRQGRGPVQSKEIAASQGIPEAYLHQVLGALNRAGLVRSSRGPTGGHELVRPPATLSVLEVVSLLEGREAPARTGVAGPTDPTIDEVWDQLAAQTDSLLAGITFQDLVDRHATRVHVPSYTI